jgi:hypothetical protein
MPEDPTGIAWVLTREALAAIGADPHARAVLAAGRVFVLLRRGGAGAVVAGLDAIPTASFGSVAEMEAAARTGDLPDDAGALLYDPEHWSFTPEAEQLDVAGSVARGLAVTRPAGLLLLAAPAVTLARALQPPRGGLLRLRPPDRYDAFLDLGIAALAAAADVVEIQAQGAVRDTERYARFVAAAAEQVRATNPAAHLLAGLSTNPPGEPVDAAMLGRAITASIGTVEGWWLNVPSPGPRCPTCNPPRPDVGIAALRIAFG